MPSTSAAIYPIGSVLRALRHPEWVALAHEHYTGCLFRVVNSEIWFSGVVYTGEILAGPLLGSYASFEEAHVEDARLPLFVEALREGTS